MQIQTEFGTPLPDEASDTSPLAAFADRSLLIVEDNKTFSARLARAMESRGYEVQVAESVAEGISAIESRAPAFAVIDMSSALRLIETPRKRTVSATGVMTMTTDTSTNEGAAGPGRGGRMSGPRKRDAVLRLLRGEDLEMVSRSLGVTAATLSGWRDAFLVAGEASLTSRPTDADALESGRLKAKLGEMLLERELLEAKIAVLEARGPGPLARRRSRP